MSQMADKGLSKSYQHQAHKAISGVFKMSMVDELVIRNPTKSVPAPRGGHKPKVVPSRVQVSAMLDQAPNPRMCAFVAVLAYTGVRIGEALSLRWSDWDGGSTLRVMDVKGREKGARPRAIPVSEKLQVELRAWRKAQAAERLASIWWDVDADWILSTDVGTQWDPHNARKRFRPIAEAICPGATPHSLRHATATILLEEGVPMRVVADVLGHSSTRITEDVYSHVTARLSAEAAAAIDRAL
jgi:integrase